MQTSPYDRFLKHERRSCGMTLTLTPSDDARIREAAERVGLSISSFVARAASIAALTELEEAAEV
jgi:uncharacterized protein (DUF1778 family)